MRASKAIGLMMLLAAVATRAGASDFAVRPASAAAPVSNYAPPLLYVPPPVGPAPPAANGVPPPVIDAVPPAPAASLDGPPAVPVPDGAGATGQFYLDANYLIAWIQSGRVPTLATTTVAGLPRGQAGVEGVPGNASLFGGSVSGSDRSGALIRGGYVLDSRCREGIEVGFIAIGRAGDTFNATSNGSRVLARPFFNTATSQSDADLVAFPGLLAGSIHVRTASELFGGEVNYRCALSCLSCGGIGCCGGCGGGGCGCGCGENGFLADSGLTVDFLIGYRGLVYKDKVVVESTTRNLDPTMIVSNRPLVHDSFYSRTMFNGGQVGLAGHYERNGFFLDGRAMSAIGVAGSRVDVTGFSNVVNGATVARSQVGLLAAQTNHGFFQDENLGFVGELGLKVGYRVSSNLSLSVGYTLLYLSSVVRSGDLIDKAVNTTQIPPATLTGPNRPALIIQNQDIFAHGLSVGAELRF